MTSLTDRIFPSFKTPSHIEPTRPPSHIEVGVKTWWERIYHGTRRRRLVMLGGAVIRTKGLEKLEEALLKDQLVWLRQISSSSLMRVEYHVKRGRMTN